MLGGELSDTFEQEAELDAEVRKALLAMKRLQDDGLISEEDFQREKEAVLDAAYGNRLGDHDYEFQLWQS